MNVLTGEDRNFLAKLKASLSAEFNAVYESDQSKVISLFDFYKQLELHDWFYAESGSYDARLNALEERSRLRKISSKHYVFTELFGEFVAWSDRKIGTSYEMPAKPELDIVISHDYVSPV